MRPTPIGELLSGDYRVCNAICDKLPGTFRIVVVGDSYTYGFGVSAEDALPAQLERALSQGGTLPHIEVVNLGRPGMNLQSERAFWSTTGRSVRTDLLLLCLSSDDAHPWPGRDVAERMPDWQESWDNQWEPTNTGLMERALSAMALELAPSGARLVVAFYQTYKEPGGAVPAGLSVVRGICRELSLPFVDLVTPFLDLGEHLLRASAIDEHPSALAHRIAAREVARSLAPLLPERRTATAAEIEALLHQQLAILGELTEGPGLAYAHVRPHVVGAASRERALELLHRAAAAQWAHQALTSAVERSIAARLDLLDAVKMRLSLAAEGVAGATGSRAIAALCDALGPAAIATRAAIETCEPLADAGSSPPLGALLRRLALCSAELEGVAATHRDARVDEDIVTRLTALADQLEQARAWLQALQPRPSGVCDVVFDVTLPPAGDATTLLNMTYAMSHPRVADLRMSLYVQCDGLEHRYALRLPPGTSGRVRFVLMQATDLVRSRAIDQPEERVRVSIRCGDTIAPHVPGSLVVAPHLDIDSAGRAGTELG